MMPKTQPLCTGAKLNLLDVIKVADHIIDLGPEGGDGGGTLVTAGTPEQVAQTPASYTGHYLKKALER